MSEQQVEPRMWFELDNPRNERYKEIGQEQAIIQLKEVYNKMFRRLGWQYDPVFWNEKECCWSFQVDTGGSFIVLPNDEPGIWLNPDHIRLAPHQLAEPREISAKNCIHLYNHCQKCFDEKPKGQSMERWSRISVGATPIGWQVWCNRHEINICHIDFQGCMHPANTSI